MQIRGMLLAAGVLALPSIAVSAQPVTGLYIGAGAGVNIMQDEAVKSVGGVSTPSGKLETNLGGVGLLNLGWGFGNSLRAEIEGDYRYNGLNKITGVPGGGSVSGSEQKYGPMVNLLYDFNGLSPTFVPYIGAGGGYQWTTYRGSSAEGAFACQAILGAAIPVASVPGLAVTAEYRFMGMPGNRNYGGGHSRVTLNDDHNHSILIGVRYAFGAPAATMGVQSTTAATPAPMVQPARSYLVFFDWDKATLSDRAARSSTRRRTTRRTCSTRGSR